MCRTRHPEPEIPAWDRDAALETLRVRKIRFERLDGDCLGFARERSIAINPVNSLQHKTRFRELAHVLLGHTAEGQQADSEITPRIRRECEAESVALLCVRRWTCLGSPSVAATCSTGGPGARDPRTVDSTHPEGDGQILKAGTTDAKADTKGGR